MAPRTEADSSSFSGFRGGAGPRFGARGDSGVRGREGFLARGGFRADFGCRGLSASAAAGASGGPGLVRAAWGLGLVGGGSGFGRGFAGEVEIVQHPEEPLEDGTDQREDFGLDIAVPGRDAVFSEAAVEAVGEALCLCCLICHRNLL